MFRGHLRVRLIRKLMTPSNSVLGKWLGVKLLEKYLTHHTQILRKLLMRSTIYFKKGLFTQWGELWLIFRIMFLNRTNMSWVCFFVSFGVQEKKAGKNSCFAVSLFSNAPFSEGLRFVGGISTKRRPSWFYCFSTFKQVLNLLRFKSSFWVFVFGSSVLPSTMQAEFQIDIYMSKTCPCWKRNSTNHYASAKKCN